MTWVDGRRLSEIYFDDFGDMLFFDYDSDGMRLRKYGPRVYDYNYAFANTPLFYVDYYYDGDTLIYERRSYNGDNESTLFTIEYLYGVNGIVGFKLDDGTAQTTYYYVKNIMGDVLGIVNASGTLVAEYRYDAYGNPVMILDGNGNDVSANYAHIANVNPIRYRGYYYDIESGFYYLNSRYYDPEIGRFINADSYVSTGQGILGTNMFAYCGNNPVVRKDPSGQRWDIVVFAKIGANIGISTYIEYISKNPIKYDVPHYHQSTNVSCAHYSHLMVDRMGEDKHLSEEDAKKRARELEGDLNKASNNLNQGTPVFESGDSKLALSRALAKGPLYGLFDCVNSSGPIDSHVVVITGYDRTNDIVYINDPFLTRKIEVTYNEFLNGYSKYYVGYPVTMVFKAAYSS